MANGDYGYFGKGDTGYAQYIRHVTGCAGIYNRKLCLCVFQNIQHTGQKKSGI